MVMFTCSSSSSLQAKALAPRDPDAATAARTWHAMRAAWSRAPTAVSDAVNKASHAASTAGKQHQPPVLQLLDDLATNRAATACAQAARDMLASVAAADGEAALRAAGEALNLLLTEAGSKLEAVAAQVVNTPSLTRSAEQGVPGGTGTGAAAVQALVTQAHTVPDAALSTVLQQAVGELSPLQRLRDLQTQLRGLQDLTDILDRTGLLARMLQINSWSGAEPGGQLSAASVDFDQPGAAAQILQEAAGAGDACTIAVQAAEADIAPDLAAHAAGGGTEVWGHAVGVVGAAKQQLVALMTDAWVLQGHLEQHTALLTSYPEQCAVRMSCVCMCVCVWCVKGR